MTHQLSRDIYMTNVFPKTRETKLEVSLSALKHNLEYYKKQISSETQVMAMVKAGAYGLGDFGIAKYLEKNGVDYFGVAYVDEGMMLRKYGVSLPILVMNPSIHVFEKALELDLEINVSNFEILDKLVEFSAQKDENLAPISVHLKIDTGMHRLGFLPSEIAELAHKLQEIKNINFKGVFSHLAMPEDDEFTLGQIHQFYEIAHQLETVLERKLIKHILNSPGITRFSEFSNDMVRLGIGLYGVGSTELESQNLKTVAVMKTIVSQVKILKKEDTVGYSRKGKIIEDNQKIAILSVGYADGYDRRFGNGVGRVLINGKSAPIIGNVCMDMTMVDVTGIDVQLGDEVILFGENPTVIELAENIGTIPYELFTNVGERVKRIFYA